MSVPESIKENVRGVLLSQTDGKGVLVSQFLRLYKGLISENLNYRDLGFGTLQEFIKAMPDVVRLEFSDAAMAYKMYGFLKPNTFASSFTKKASGSSASSGRSSQPRSSGQEDGKYDLNKNQRGLYSLCFPKKRAPDLTSREAISAKFAAVGNIDEINIIPMFVFVRFRQIEDARKALDMFGDKIGLRVADERQPKTQEMDRRREQEREQEDLVVNNTFKPPQKKRDYETNGGQNDTVIQRNEKKTEVVQVYMGNFPYTATEEDLSALIAEFSPLRCRIKKNKEDRRKVFAFVDFDEVEAAGVMVRALNGIKFMERNLQVRFANRQLEMQQAEADLTDHKVGRGAPTSQDERIIMNGNHQGFHNKFDTGAETRTTGSSAGTRSDVHVNGAGLQYGSHFNSNERYERSGSIEEEFSRLAVHKDRSSEVNAGNGLLPTPQLHVYPPAPGISGDASSSFLPHSPKAASIAASHSPVTIAQLSPASSRGRSSGSEDFMPHLSPMKGRGQFTSQNALQSPRSAHGHREMPSLEPTSPERRSKHESSFSSRMPKLEPVSPQKMPKLEPNSLDSSVRSLESDDDEEAVQIFIGNFPYGTTEEDLIKLFAKYDIQELVIMNHKVTNRSTYAFAKVSSLARAQMAILDLDQSLLSGRRLIVGMANPVSKPSKQPPNELARITCTIGKAVDSERLVTVSKDQSHRMTSPRELSPIPFDAGITDDGPPRLQTDMHRLSHILRTYAIAVVRLNAEGDFLLPPKTRIRVHVTDVLDNQFFWGQVIEDNHHGNNSSLVQLQRIMEELQQDVNRPGMTKGLGRCAALYEGEWYRGWAMFQKGEDEVDVIYIDYGNTAKIPKLQTRSTTSLIWNLWPVAKPYKSIEVRDDLSFLENQVVTLELQSCGSPNTNFLSYVRIVD